LLIKCKSEKSRNTSTAEKTMVPTENKHTRTDVINPRDPNPEKPEMRRLS
jgi:hypothetical protein